jgi:hypothetical protein
MTAKTRSEINKQLDDLSREVQELIRIGNEMRNCWKAATISTDDWEKCRGLLDRRDVMIRRWDEQKRLTRAYCKFGKVSDRAPKEDVHE